MTNRLLEKSNVSRFDRAGHPLISSPSKIGQSGVFYENAREVLTRATGFMEKYDFTLNPYSGCSFGCTYCYAAFFSMSKEDRDAWGQWVKVKENAIDLLGKRKPGYLDGKLIYMSSVTDPYQPIERKLELTRGLLKIMAERHKPRLVVQTRSPDVVRDCDLFRQTEANERDLFGRGTKEGGRVQVNMTVTTDDEDLRRTFEPFCPANGRRLDAIAQVQKAGIDTCITMTPLLWINEPESFADRLLATGVKKFIAQPFHFQHGKFVASTRDHAVNLMVEKLGCRRDEYQDRYMKHYERVYEVLKSRLPELGEGKEGFNPPF